MFPLLSVALGLSRVNISRPSLFSWQAWRFFSQSHVNSREVEDPIARRKRLDRQIEQFRVRMADPNLREGYNAMRRARYRNNVETQRERARLRYETWREQNPEEYKEWRRRNKLACLHQQATDPRFGFTKRLHGWCVNQDWVREELPWKTHVPVVYPVKVHKPCYGCTHLKQGGGVRLWWERPCHSVPVEQTNHTHRWRLRNDNDRADEERYLCHACYVGKDTWQNALPKGYEDVRYMQDLIARKKELDDVDHGRQTTKDTKSK